MRTLQYKGIKYDLFWGTPIDKMVFVAHCIHMGHNLIVNSCESQDDCTSKMEAEIETKIIAHQI